MCPQASVSGDLQCDGGDGGVRDRDCNRNDPGGWIRGNGGISSGTRRAGSGD